MKTKYKKQRALVLQGGGALGAYEAGAIYELCVQLYKKDGGNDPGKALFDVIAGTSIGAINGAVLVSQFQKKRNDGLIIPLAWYGAAEKLIEFWKYLSSPSLDIDKVLQHNGFIGFENMIKNWKIGSDNGTVDIATKEAFERYLFGKISLKNGLEKIYDKPSEVHDKRFYDVENIWNKYNNNKLRESIKNTNNGATFPIKTTFDENNPQPRLLVVSVDIENGSAVTFDSYEKPDGSRKTVYLYNEKDNKIDHDLCYPGIELQHIMASSAVPLFYDFENIDNRKFWGGIILSNTPLKELMEEHKAYWEYKIGDEILSKSVWMGDDGEKVLDLEVYVINVYPRIQKVIKNDYDSLKTRLENIKYSDKTTYEEWVADLLTDYLDIIEKIIKKGDKKGLKNDIEDILNGEAKSNLFTYLPKKEPYKYKDIIKRRFKIEVKRIERKDDDHSVSTQITDFTESTINRLIEEGKKDVRNAFEKGFLNR
ncbi:MAG TPA: patatin-like phospholipase family protein [Candidatus Nitrosocosmicus sp.]